MKHLIEYEYLGMVIPPRLSTPTSQNGTPLKSQGSCLDNLQWHILFHNTIFILRAACIYMDINLKPQERHRMFSERMTFWNMFTYKEMLEEYAVDNKEARMLIEIETAIDESEDDAENDDEDEDDAEEEEISGQRRGGGRRGLQRRRKARLERRWRKGGNRFKKLFKKKNAAKLEARKRRRLAKKLKKMME